MILNNLRKIVDLLKKFDILLNPNQKKNSVIILLLTLLGSFVETIGVSVILPLMQVVIDSGNGSNKSNLFAVYDKLGIVGYNNKLLCALIALVIVYIVKNVFLSFLSVYRAFFSKAINKDLTIQMMKSYISRGYMYLKNTNTAELMRGCTEAGNAIQLVIYNLLKLMAEAITVVMILFYIAVTDIELVLFMGLIMLSCVLIVTSLFKRRTQKAGRESYEYMAEATKWMLQLFGGIKEVLVMKKADFFVDKYRDAYSNKLSAMTKQTVFTELPTYVIEAICVSGVMISIGTRLIMLDNPVEYIPIMAVFAMGVFRILPSLGRITSYMNIILYHIPPVNDAYSNISTHKDEVMETELVVCDCMNDRILFSDSIEIKSISYKYPDGENRILDNLNMKIQKGESVAIVGPSGAGKTTLSDMILGLLKPDSGSIYVDGKDIYDYLDNWSNMIGFVPQGIYLLDDTIKRNIALGVEDAYIDETRVKEALHKAQIQEYIDTLPDGLDTVIGERGVKFSGGQAQRLAIARALYNDPDILIFDEATSALDSSTEKAVMDAINRLRGEKTMIIIAHRLSTIKECNTIYEIVDGKAIKRIYEEINVR